MSLFGVRRGGEPLRVTRVPTRGGCRVVLEGSIDERANLKKQLDGLSGTVVFDLDRVSRLTSFGVLEWRSALKSLEGVSYYAFIRARPTIVTQFNLVDGFGERGELVSFYVPYICNGCANEFELLVDLRHHYSVAVSREPPYALCRKCGAEAVFDGLPEEFLSYVGSRPRPHVPAAAFQLIDGLVGDVVETLKVRKEIDGAVTAVILSGPVNGGARLRSAMEGVEGFLVLDLRAVTTVDEAGARKLAEAISQMSVIQLCFARLPIALLAAVAAQVSSEMGSGGICSVIVQERCNSCLADREFEIGRRNLGPRGVEAWCAECRSKIRLFLPQEAVVRLRACLIEPAPEIAGYLEGRQAALTTSGEFRAGELQRALSLPVTVVGDSAVFREILETLRRVAPTATSVLLRGETGTGKEMLARLVHALSPRRDEPFVAINCAALPENLIESELFGHERGAFTGATQTYLGRFERARGGTLFIDEVGDIPLSVQVKLLRALQEKCIERVGSGESIPIDVRVVAATHRSLEQMMHTGQFREDLFFRISVVPVVVPPLRQRPSDIWPLALHYLGEAQRRNGRTGIRFSERMRHALEQYDWPGNVRELINVIERAVALTPSNGLADLVEFGIGARPTAPQPVVAALAGAAAPPPNEQRALDPPSTRLPLQVRRDARLKDAVDEYEKQLIAEALARADGNRTRAAQALGISRQALLLKITKHGL